MGRSPETEFDKLCDIMRNTFVKIHAVVMEAEKELNQFDDPERCKPEYTIEGTNQPYRRKEKE